jgi:hypothetical protein
MDEDWVPPAAAALRHRSSGTQPGRVGHVCLPFSRPRSTAPLDHPRGPPHLGQVPVEAAQSRSRQPHMCASSKRCRLHLDWPAREPRIQLQVSPPGPRRQDPAAMLDAHLYLSTAKGALDLGRRSELEENVLRPDFRTNARGYLQKCQALV